MNLADWIVGTLVFAALATALFKILRDRKNGAGCGCSSCPSCSSAKQDTEKKQENAEQMGFLGVHDP
ncbi:MAG: FeoB-associated Cys-rich membrane protein [Synergistaceae bacterium]|jgi:hypothetical protein|nr:FeoB-associated Cys-rich membrane protein [Synergistaceae bacterium]